MTNQKQIQDLITFFQRANKLKSVPRFSASLWKEGDTVAEHSWRLSLMTYTIATEFNLQIDLPKALAIAMLHDLAESITGDIDAVHTYEAYKEKNKQISKEEKYAAEKKAMDNIMNGIFFGEKMKGLWQEYEDQQSIEAKLVKALDKLEAFLHLADTPAEAFSQDEFHASYADEAVQHFDDAANHFPELKDMLDTVKETLKQKYTKAGIAWKQ